MERVHMSLGIEQARAVGAELDLANRIHLGQFTEIANLASQGEITIKDEHAPGGWRVATHDEVDDIREACERLARLFGHSRTSHFGIGSQGVRKAARRGYEVKKALDCAVARHLDPNGMTVHHDGLAVRYTQDDPPTAWVEG